MTPLGHDTTAVGILWTLLSIGSEPEVQARIHDELDSIFSDDPLRPIAMEDLKKMTYLEATIKEALRLYPSAPLVARRLHEPLEVPGYTIPPGCTVFVMADVLGMNPEVFPEPEKFDPDRFLVENAAGRDPFAYVPFSAGPRSCIGQRFALIEEKVMTASILRKFRLESKNRPEDLKRTVHFVLRSLDPVWVRFLPRE